jgi:Tetratricopeptide repeat
MTTGDRQCPDDLLVRGIRQQVSQLERRALDAHLGQCTACQAASALAALFDAVPETVPGDSELLARVSSRATRKQAFARRWIRAAAVAATVVVFTGGVAAAWVAVGRRVLESRSAEKPTVPPPAHERLAHRAPVISREIPPPPLETSPLAPASPEIAAPAVPRKRPEPPLSVAAPAPSMQLQLAGPGESRIEPPAADQMPEAALRAEKIEPVAPRLPSQFLAQPETRHDDSRYTAPDARSLFAEANAVRRAGELGRAVGLYQRLRRDFPKSVQSLLASVSAADLLLRLGDPAGAIAAYDSYLEHASGGALTEEALFGRARCLARLGRTAEERQTWEDLVHGFPQSAYQPVAIKRLGELRN